MIAHAMSYCRFMLDSMAPCCELFELAMDAAELRRWLASGARLTPAQKAEFLNALGARDDESVVGQLVELRLAQLLACPIAPARGSFSTVLAPTEN